MKLSPGINRWKKISKRLIEYQRIRDELRLCLGKASIKGCGDPSSEAMGLPIVEKLARTRSVLSITMDNEMSKVEYNHPAHGSYNP